MAERQPEKHPDQPQPNSIANHILPTSSNLLGICFVILSFIKVSHIADTSFLDEFIGVPIFLFFVASILSYLSIRSPNRAAKLERVADAVFIAGLSSLSIVAFVFLSNTLQ